MVLVKHLESVMQITVVGKWEAKPMQSINNLKICCWTILIILGFSMYAEAGKIKYSFSGNGFTKIEEVSGKIERTTYCKNQINVELLGISKETVENSYDDIYVSSDERFFTFHGSYGRQGEWRFFLADIVECKVIRKLALDEVYHPFNYAAAFSPDSKKLYISMYVRDINKDGDAYWISKEYGGEDFKDEKKLKAIYIPTRAIDGKGNYLNFFKFSKNGKYMVTVDNKTWEASIFNVLEDEKITSFKLRDFTKNKYYHGEFVPDVENGMLLYNFDTGSGTEIDIIDYINKKLKNKIEVEEKGLGKLVSNGDKVIFTSFADMKTTKKNVTVYETQTGRVLGKTILNTEDEVVDMASDGKYLIYKQKNLEKKTEIK